MNQPASDNRPPSGSQKHTSASDPTSVSKSSEHVHDPADQSWIERNVNVIIYALIVACILTLVAQLYPGFGEHHHSHFKPEDWFGFSGVFGFVAFVVVVFLGRGLRMIVQRSEDYYDA